MATKKQIPVKKGKTVKPAAKKVIKTVKKPVPAKKSASAKKATVEKFNPTATSAVMLCLITRFFAK